MSISPGLIARIVQDALPPASTFEGITDTSLGQGAHFRLADGTRLTLTAPLLPRQPRWWIYWTPPGNAPTQFFPLTLMSPTQLHALWITSQVERLLQSKEAPAT